MSPGILAVAAGAGMAQSGKGRKFRLHRQNSKQTGPDLQKPDDPDQVAQRRVNSSRAGSGRLEQQGPIPLHRESGSREE
jgi:hypothetical protein